MTNTVNDILVAIQSALGRNEIHDAPLSLHEPSFAKEERKAVLDCLDTGWASSAGVYVETFEKQLAEYCGVRHAIACVNGTAALHIALSVAGVGAGEEVIVPAISFIATANAVIHNQSIPHFVDINVDDFGIDPSKLTAYLDEITEQKNGKCFNKQTGRRIAAIVPMHCFGYASQIVALLDIAENFGLALVEDAAESLGTTYDGKPLGSFGRTSILSFNGNKIITSGGGGAILTQDSELAKRARHITTTAKLPHKWEYCHDELGYNYRLPGLNAALGVGQFSRIKGFLKSKLILHEAYAKSFSTFPDVRLLEGCANSVPNHWLNTIILPEDMAGMRDDVLFQAHAAGLMLRPLWGTLPDQAHLRYCPTMQCPVARQMEARTLCLPSSPFLAQAK